MKLIVTDNVYEIGEVVTDIIYDYKANKISSTIAFGKTNPKMKILEAIKNAVINEEINFSYDKFNYCDFQNQYDDLKTYFNSIGDVERSNIVITEMNELGHIGLNKEAEDFNTIIHEEDGIKTLGIKDILRADELIVVASGPKVAKMIEYVLDSEENPKIPATVLPSFENVTLVIDKLAAKYVKDEN